MRKGNVKKRGFIFLFFSIFIVFLIMNTDVVLGEDTEDPVRNIVPGDFVYCENRTIGKGLFPNLPPDHFAMYLKKHGSKHIFIESTPVFRVHRVPWTFIKLIWSDRDFFYVKTVSDTAREKAVLHSWENFKWLPYQYDGFLWVKEGLAYKYNNWDPEDEIPWYLPFSRIVEDRCVPRTHCLELVWAGYMNDKVNVNIATQSYKNGYGDTGYHREKGAEYVVGDKRDPNVVGGFTPDNIPLSFGDTEVTVTVDGDLPEDDPQNNTWNTIQKGVDNLSSLDVLYLKDGMYIENIIVNKSITIMGESTENVIINGSMNAIASHDYELPHNGKTDPITNVNMAGNVLLLRFNNDISVGENYSSSNNVFDYSLCNNNGTNNFANWTTITLKGNGSMDFNGIDNYVNLTSIPALVGENVTISAWIKWTGGSGSADPIVSQSNATHGYCIYVNSTTGKPVFRLAADEAIASNSIDNGWHYIVGTHNETMMKIFVDGALSSSSSITGSGIDRDFYVGYDNISSYFNGIIDELAVWNRTLTDDEISRIYELNYGLTLINLTIKNGDVGVTPCNNTLLCNVNIVNQTVGIQIGNVSGLWIYSNISNCDTAIRIENSNPDKDNPNIIGFCNISNCTIGSVINSSTNIIMGYSQFNNCNTNLSFNNCNLTLIQIGNCISKGNVGPDKPSISGPTFGEIRKSYTYYSVTNDSDNEQLFYQFYWGDGNTTGVIGPYLSNETVNVSHVWEKHGGYYIYVIVKDLLFNESWSDFILFKTEMLSPLINSVNNSSDVVGYGKNVIITANVTDDTSGNYSGINCVWINISYPANISKNFSMTYIGNNIFEYVFSDTWLVGEYNYSIWAMDNAYNVNNSSGYGFNVDHIFGSTIIGSQSQNTKDRITGSSFTIPINATVDNITAYIKTNLSTPPKTRCLIYKANDSVLIGTSEEKTLNTGSNPAWITYNFTGSEPSLVKDTDYVLVCWSNDTCNLFYENSTNVSNGRYANCSYSTAPNPINWSSYELRVYSIYCSYSTVPDITNVSASPGFVGFGSNVTICADVDDIFCKINNVSVNITYPNNTTGNFTMNNAGNDTFQYVFSDTWQVGQYNYTIWASNKLGGINSNSGHYFNVSAQATISVCTIKDEYGNNESINITDPPGDSYKVGYELLDDGKVLHIWNVFDSYYFNTSNGIQFTNHKDDYWCKNVLMLGYYNNDAWNLIYRADNLNGFNKNVKSDNETFVNATLWKDLTYQGYDFRLTIRYYLGVDDNELTVMPYIKNLDENNIPYDLGFGWELKDIHIDITPEYDYIEINNDMYYLNQTLDETYTNLTQTCFYIKEDKTSNTFESLYLKWNDDLNYKVKVKSRDGQYNAPVTLGIKIGTLSVDQEKYTSIYWHDASEITYYFDDYDEGGEVWASNPSYITDGSVSNYASTQLGGDIELCNNNTCPGDDLGVISKVEIRAYGYYISSQRDIYLRPVFNGTTDSNDYTFATESSAGWSRWFDITNDGLRPSYPSAWTWAEVRDLDCDVEAENLFGFWTLYCSKVEVRVTYNNLPGISSSYPIDGSKGITLTPTLNITVSDPDGDNLNISWLSNSSGSWQVFGTNSSVGNGTYYQVFSNASINGQWWFWKVNVSDDDGYNISNVYKFYTGVQSKIVNTGSANINGYLLIQVQYYNTTTLNWDLVNDTINETTMRTLAGTGGYSNNSSSVLGLDTIFNGLVNSSSLLDSFGAGTYRVYAAFRDPDGDVLICDDETLLEATYNFTIASS